MYMYMEPASKDTDRVNTEQLLTVYLEEYKMLRVEISDRVKNEFAIIASSIAFTGVAVAALSHANTYQAIAMLMTPWISFVLGVVYVGQEINIAQAAEYIHNDIRPAIIKLLNINPQLERSVLNWENFCNPNRFHAIPGLQQSPKAMSAAQRASGLMSLVGGSPGIVVLIFIVYAYSTSNAYKHPPGTYVAFFMVDVLLYVILVCYAVGVHAKYNRITGSKSEA